jgi:uncharacterized DUF497 family protein
MSEPFEWDKAKAAENYAKHGVSFETAVQGLQGSLCDRTLDDREDYGEERFILIGIAEEAIVTVVYTERNGRFRIISARRATRHEQDDYFVENE